MDDLDTLFEERPSNLPALDPVRRLPSSHDAIVQAVSTTFPAHYYDQEALLRRFRELWGKRFRNADRIEQLHRSVQVAGRHLALSMEETAALKSFDQANDAYIRCAVDLGSQALASALTAAGLTPRDIDTFFSFRSPGLRHRRSTLAL